MPFPGQRLSFEWMATLIDPITLGSLFDRHAGVLVLLARQHCDVPEDVVQESFLKLSRTTPVPDNCIGWLYQVTRRGAIDAGRSRSVRKRNEAAKARLAGEWFQLDPASQLDQEAAVEQLRLLDASVREIIIAHLWGGLTFEQIAQVCEMSSSSAHRQFQAGLEQIRQRLGVTHG